MVFAIHWDESAMDLHVFPILIPPPTSLSTQSLWVFPVHQPQEHLSQKGKHVFKLTQTNLFMKQKQTHRLRERLVVAGGGGGRMGKDGVGVPDQQVQTITHRMDGLGPSV